MKNHRSNFSGINNILKASVCAGALMAMINGVAYGQFGGSVSGQGSRATDHDDLQFHTEVMMPFGNNMGQMFYGLVGTGYRDSDPVFSLGAGYRVIPGAGQMLLGINLRTESWRGQGKNWFYGVAPGVEFVWGGLSVSASAYMPVGKTTRSVKGSERTGGALIDKPAMPGSCNVRNSAPICDLVIQSLGRDRERNNWGGDIQLGYRLPFFDSMDIELGIGGYMFDRKGERNLTGLTGGVDVRVPLSNQFSVNAGGQLRRESQGGRGTDGVFNVGFTYQWGGSAAGNASYLERRMGQAPHRFDSAKAVQVIGGPVLAQQKAIWTENPANVPVSEVRFVHARNQGNAAVIVANTAQDGIVVFDGRFGNIQVNTNLSVGQNNVGVIGGATLMTLKGATDGKTYQYTMAGTSPIIRQTNNASDVFTTINHDHVIFRNLEVRDGQNHFTFSGAKDAKITDITSTNAGANSFVFTNASTGARITDILSNTATGSGLVFQTNSNNAIVESAWINRANGNAIVINGVTNTQINNSRVVGGKAGAQITDNGAVITNANGTIFRHVHISFATQDGIQASMSTGLQFENVDVVNSSVQGLRLNQVNGAKLTDVAVNTANSHGITVAGSDKVEFSRVQVGNVLGDGIRLVNATNMQLSRVTVNTASGNGIDLSGNSTGTVFAQVSIENVAAIGLNLGGGSNNTSMTNLQVFNSGQEAIRATNSNNLSFHDVWVRQQNPSSGTGIFLQNSNMVILDRVVMEGHGAAGSSGLHLLNVTNANMVGVITRQWAVGYNLGAGTTLTGVNADNQSLNDAAACDTSLDVPAPGLPVQVNNGAVVNCR